MRSVSKRLGRSAALLTLLTIFVAHGAGARQWGDEPTLRQRFERVKRVIVTVLSRFDIPPGKT
jgi:hypothetical protein